MYDFAESNEWVKKEEWDKTPRIKGDKGQQHKKIPVKVRQWRASKRVIIRSQYQKQNSSHC